jgi:N-acetylglucosaminyl-diphospho-decaprenol L-rhamnosyltransferase
VRLLTPGSNLGAAGRNLGVLTAETPYVAFCDDDTWWSAGALRRAEEPLDDHPRVAVLTARIIVEPAGTEDPICSDLSHSPLPTAADLPGPQLVSFLAGASVVHRDAFLAVGGFEPRSAGRRSCWRPT